MEEQKAQELYSGLQGQLQPRAQVALDELTKVSSEFLNFLNAGLPASRETSLAVTKVQEGMMWAAASITQNMQ